LTNLVVFLVLDMQFPRPRIKQRTALHLERLEDRFVMDGAGFVHTNPEPDPGSVVGVAEIEAQDDYVETGFASGQLRIDVLANDPLPAGSTGLKIKSVSQTLRGASVTVSDDGTHLLYTAPSAGYGFDSFYYIVEDGAGKLGKANVTIGRKHYGGGGSPGQGEPNVESNDHYNFIEDSPPQVLDVLRNDRLSPPAEIVEVSEINGIGGTVVIADDGKTLLYTLPYGKIGNAWFDYTFQDTNGETGTQRVHISIEKPYKVGSDLNFFFPIGVQHAVMNVLDDDLFRGVRPDGPTIIAVSQPEYGGTLSISEDGRKVIFTPTEEFLGRISFSYTVRYGELEHQTVVGREYASIYNTYLAVDNWFAVDVDSNDNGLDVLANDPTMRNGVTLSIIGVSAGNAGGQITVTPDNKLRYTPAAGFTGEEKFTYTVRDSNSHEDTAEVTVQVAPQFATDGVPKFTLPGELEQFLIDQAVERYKSQFGYSFQQYIGPEYPIWLQGTVSDDVNYISTAYNADHSETNTQEAGVDEADIVETDGQFVYSFAHGKLVIVDVSDTSHPLLVSFTAFDERYGEMYLQGDKITLIQRGYNTYFPSVVTVLDVSDRAHPVIQERTEIAGRIVDSRAVGDHVYVAVSGLELPPVESQLSQPASAGGVYEIRTNETLDQYVARVRATLIESSLPTYKTYNAAGEIIASGLLTDPTQIHKPIDAIDNELISLVTFDVSHRQAGPDSSTGIFTSNAAQVYMSGSSFYVMRQNAGETAIFKFAIDENGVATLVATGKFGGWLLNQFSVDEHEGRLRIATTQDVMETVVDQWGRGWIRQQRRFNNLLVLEQNGTELEVVGKITNLAPTELIKSVRFLEDRAYVTTFRVIDPLFTIDLSDPTHPEVQGALKIPGFSDYLHPVGEDYVIGIGRDANEITGELGALQISLFYVGDMANPTLVDQVTMEGANWHWTEAWYDHHAVAFFPEDGVLTIPVSWYESTAETLPVVDHFTLLPYGGIWHAREQHSAIWTFEIEVDGQGGGSIEIGGSIDHAAGTNNQARRSMRVGDALITLSEDYLRVNNLHDVNEQWGAAYLGILPRDDQFSVNANGSSVMLDVLANDREGVGGNKPLIVGVTQPRSWSWNSWGTIDDSLFAVDFVSTGIWVTDRDAGTIAIAEDGASLIFTPHEGFVGTATFTYTVFDELRGEQTATVTITIAATTEFGEIVLESPTRPVVDQPALPQMLIETPVLAGTEPLGTTAELAAPIPNSAPQGVILLSIGGDRGETVEQEVGFSRAVEAQFAPPALDLRAVGFFTSYAHDDIFDTFHTTRSRSIAELPADLYTELAAEFAGT
jgi:uncharacterized secreted protein with C-terminal beta-propeller domain